MTISLVATVKVNDGQQVGFEAAALELVEAVNATNRVACSTR